MMRGTDVYGFDTVVFDVSHRLFGVQGRKRRSIGHIAKGIFHQDGVFMGRKTLWAGGPGSSDCPD
jgi:hypothetical protein